MTYAVIRTDGGRLGGGRMDDHHEGRAVAWGFESEEVAEAAAESHGTNNEREYVVVDDYGGR